MKYVLASLFIFISFSVAFAQEDIWYVWVDTQINKGGEVVRLVSNEPIRITCCVKSPKFKRLQKKTAKWIKDNYDQNFDLESPLKNIEDKSLAFTVIGDAEKKAESGENILMIKYTTSCK